MRFLAYILVFNIFLSVNLFAQDSIQAKNYQVTGNIQDQQTRQPVEYASIVLLHARDSSLLGGIYSDVKGHFSIPVQEPGNYVLKITFMGYETYEAACNVVAGQPNTQLGKILLVPQGKKLNAVEITSQKPAFSMQIDRQVFDGSSIITAEGGTATDALRNLPGVDVDMDNNVTIRGKSISVYIDGKPSPFGDPQTALEIIPAESIDRIEIINNPSAKFEAQGGGGIINIVLKRDRAMGYNTMLTAGIDNRGQNNASVNGNLRVRRFNLFGHLNMRNGNGNGEGLSRRKNLYQDSSSYFNQSTFNDYSNHNWNGKIGIDYYINNHNTVTISQGLSNYSNSNNDSLYLSYLDEHYMQSQYRLRDNHGQRTGGNNSTTLYYKRTYEKAGKELTAYITHSGNHSDPSSEYNTDVFRMPADTFIRRELRTNTGRSRQQYWNAQVDYTTPVGNKGKFESGAKAVKRDHSTNNLALIYDFDLKQFDTSVNLSNHYDYDEQLFAAYGTYANVLGRIGYQAGLRVEQVTLEGYSYTKNLPVSNKFLNFFPSLFLKYDLKENRNLVFNYATRTERPRFDQLLPYINDSDPQNLRTGNPELQPSFTHKLELNYTEYYPETRNYLNTGFYYNRTEDLVDRVSTINKTTGITTTMPQNVATNQDWGIMATYRWKITDWWTHTTTLHGVYARFDGILDTAAYSRENASLKISFNSQFRLPRKFSLQLSGRYATANIMAQGSSKPMNGIDLGIRKQLMKHNKLVIAVNISDLLNTRQYSSHIETANFIQDYERKRLSRLIRLNIRYRFGKIDPNLFSRKKVAG
ncbi:hypothetical protein COR50_13605 [Chitinophaga caeni]|uniref:TonB-dependent receptor n=1 Tax=Chitinophaga caeni TaxID=2029983 RepID=A0A291QW86_9BACT|nr:TonB-dependent receptor [Chitinophaga caeni]ATL48114.1 hypothetical protein COR50_13605 [Chitinophaga caeni]